MDKRYEFWVTEKYYGSFDASAQMGLLNEMTDAGWEFITITPNGQYIFRKERT